MTAQDFTLELFCRVDDTMKAARKHPLAVLHPSEVVTIGLLLALRGQGQRAFYSWLTYWMKAGFASVESTAQPIKVRAPTGSDKAAIAYLAQHGLSVFFTKDLFLREYMDEYERAISLQEEMQITDPRADLQNLIKLYPKSRYAQWAQLGLFFVREVPLIHPFLIGHKSTPESVAALQKLQKEIEAAAPTFASPMKTLMWFEAGVVASFLKDTPVAEVNFKKALASGHDATMADRIQIFKEFLASTQSAPTRPDAKAILNETIRELEARRYDVKGFPDKHPKEYAEYLKEALPLLDQVNQRKITEEEFYRRSAELFREYVTRYWTAPP